MYHNTVQQDNREGIDGDMFPSWRIGQTSFFLNPSLARQAICRAAPAVAHRS
jgi:hypothetical protein